MTVRRRFTLLGALAVLAAALVGLLALTGLSDFDLSGRTTRPLAFETPEGRIQGTLLLPDAPTAAYVVLVHGDGPQDRTAGGGYLPLLNALLDAGIAVYSWDKPGIGESEGNWLGQSMHARADEAQAALDALIAARPDAADRSGFLGFSQAGWVLPDLAARPGTPTRFAVSIGAALDWQRQGDYYTRRRLAAEGMPERRISDELASLAAREDDAFARYARGEITRAEAARVFDVSPARFDFIRRNRFANASSDLEHARIPYLAMWGEEDLNVDAAWNAAACERLLEESGTPHRVILVQDATHSLLHSALFNHQLAGDWPWYARVAFLGLGRAAYAPGTLETLTTWIRAAASGPDAFKAAASGAE